MVDDACTCGSTADEQETESEPIPERLLTDSPVLDVTFPADVRAALGRVLGEEGVETLTEWTAEVRRRTGGGPLAVDDLCHASERTGHWGEMDGDRYHFLCFYDAVILAALSETPVDIRTESPDGTVIEAHAEKATELTVTPEGAVFSFGVDETVEPPSDGSPSHADVYAAVCPYVRAFPHPEAYDQWARTVPAATVAMPLSGATEFAAKLVE